MKKKLKIAYVCIEDSEDLTQWSGLHYYIKKAISYQDIEVVVIDKLKINKSFPVLARKILGKLTKRSYHHLRSKTILKSIGFQIQKRLPKDVDFILATSSLPITYLKTDIPLFFYSDATFHSMLDFYWPMKKLSKRTLKEGEQHEQLVYHNSTGIIFASEWAANDAIIHYKVPKKKIKIIPFGANLDYPISEKEIINNLKNKLIGKTINLLFIGVDWKRKGGNTVYKTAKNLIKQGYEVKLDIVGIKNLPIKRIPSFCINHGFVSKNDKEGKSKLIGLYLEADFLFVPSRQECLGIVFAEASSLGIPSISTNVGGILNVIENGKTGFALDVNSTPKEYEEKILSLVNNKKAYEEMSLNAFHKAVTESNWENAGREIINHMVDLSQ